MTQTERGPRDIVSLRIGWRGDQQVAVGRHKSLAFDRKLSIHGFLEQITSV
jgi:hypothetical protein